jgi:hypothetical protein
VNQLVKGCQLAMNSVVLLIGENENLRTENQRQKRKRVQKRSFIAKGGILIGAEAQVLIDNGQNT